MGDCEDVECILRWDEVGRESAYKSGRLVEGDCIYNCVGGCGNVLEDSLKMAWKL